MNDRVNKLYEGITNISEETVEEAQAYRPRGKVWRLAGKWALAAACVVLVAVSIWAVLRPNLQGPATTGSSTSGGTTTGGSTTGGSSTGSSGSSTGGHSSGGSTSGGSTSGGQSGGSTSGGSGGVSPGKEDSHYPDKPWYYRENEWISRQRFALQPLSVLGESPGLTMERSVELDFTDGWNLCVATEKTVVTNAGDTAQTVTMVLPFYASLWDNASCIPVVTVDGAETEEALSVGPFPPAAEYPDNLILEGLLTEEYRARAFDELPSLPEGQAVIYSLSIPEVDMYHRNYRVTFTYPLNPEKTAVLSTCDSKCSYDPETGLCTRILTLNQLAKERVWFIVCGEDLAEYSVAVYQDMSLTIPADWAVTLTRKETELAPLLDRLLTGLWEDCLAERALADSRMISPVLEDAILTRISRETFIGLYLESLEDQGPLAYSAETADSKGRLDDIPWRERMMYVTFPVTVPAGGSVEIVTSARLRQGGGYGYWGSYLIVSDQAGNIPCTKLAISVSGMADADMLLDDNMGLDPLHGVMEFTPDPAEKKFWHVDVTEVPRPKVVGQTG